LADDLAHDRQSEAHAGDLGGEVGQEEAVAVLAGDAGPGVGDDQPHARRLGHVLRLERHGAAGADGPHRVVDEVEDGTLDVIGIGVKGFLISWAMRCATSRHAASRWALSSSVRSSKTTTAPSNTPSGPRSAVAEASSERATPPRRMCSWMAAVAVLGRRVRWTSVTTSRASGPVKTSSSKRPMVAASATPNMRAAARL